MKLSDIIETCRMLFLLTDSHFKKSVFVLSSLLLLSKIIIVSNIYLYKVLVDCLAKNSHSYIFLIIGTYGFLRFFSIFLAEVKDYQFGIISINVTQKLAKKSFRQLQYLGFSFLSKHQASSLSRITEKGLQAIELLSRHFICHILPLCTEILLISIFLIIFYSYIFSLIILLTITIYTYYTIQVTTKRLSFRNEMNAADSEVYSLLHESLTNFEIVKNFKLEEKIETNFNQTFQKFKYFSIKNIKMMAVLNIGQSLILSLGTIAAMGVAGLHYTQGKIAVGDFVLLNLLVFQTLSPVVSLGYIYREVSQSFQDLKALWALFSIRTNIIESVNPKNIDDINSISFDDVSFSYGKSSNLLKNLSFKANAGKKLAIVGLSGVGKSTVIRLLLRFFDVNNGEISINGINVKDIELKNLQNLVGIVPQNILFFRGTIYENICCWDTDINKTKIEEAAKSALIHDHISILPDGYETQIGEGGHNLSAGEKQRLAIARILAKNPPVWVFDEPTSSLDFQTERAILNNLNSYFKNKIVIFIAHRLHTIKNFDEILFFKNGKIVERGTHQQLIKKGGYYSDLWDQQNQLISPR